MADEAERRRLATRLIHPDSHASTDFKSFAVPTYRGSTVLFPNMDAAEQPLPGQYRYGIDGTPTARELSARLAAIEGAEQVFLAPSGLAAISLTLLALTSAGGRVLLPESAYGPTGALLGGLLARFGVAMDPYDPLIGHGIADLITPDTQLIWCESPGSITMEVQDIPAIAAAAKARAVPVAIDNTYGAGVLFDAFAAGADVSVQALTKYQGGHSDVLMGSVAVRSPDLGAKLARAQRLLGLSASPDDCSLVLRGLKTLDLRLRHLGESAIQVAKWLALREEVTAVLHPAFPDCPGHETWKRDWSGSASVFSVILGRWTREQVVRFVDSLRLFGIGYSWGGANSLAFTYRDLKRPSPELGPLLVRLNIGLEDPADLIADLEQALESAVR
ncbi:cystathionine beta-lyase [Sphingomonas sp. GCM10030256]|uniref:cystathionine beta-lyase n=1 Tax=Sphingomonas sp. GCM10030256 TaxID=3273427 RepID=UPI00361069D4